MYAHHLVHQQRGAHRSNDVGSILQYRSHYKRTRLLEPITQQTLIRRYSTWYGEFVDKTAKERNITFLGIMRPENAMLDAGEVILIPYAMHVEPGSVVGNHDSSRTDD